MRAMPTARSRRLLWIGALLLASGAIAGGASGSFRHAASVIANGGGPAASTTVREPASVIGQATEGGTASSASFRNTEGFLAGGIAEDAGADTWVVR